MTRLLTNSEASVDANDLRTTPFGHVLLELFDARRTGTLLVYAVDESLDAAIRIESGRPTAVLAAEQGECRVSDILMPLCARVEGRFEFLQGQDLVGSDGLFAAGAIDPLPMVMAAARKALREDVVEPIMRLVSRSLIKLSPGVDLKRYGFTAEERLVVRGLDQGPVEFEELNERVQAPADVVERVLYVLRITRGIALLPLQRMVSGVVFHAPPLAAPSTPPSSPGRSQRPATARSEQPTVPVQSQQPSRSPLPRSSRTPLAFGAVGSNSNPPQTGRSTSARPGDEGAQKDNAEALWQQAKTFSRREQHDAALRAAHRAVKLGTPSPAREALLGWLIYQHDGAGLVANDHVWKCLNRALKREPLCEEALYYKGLVLGRTGEPDHAYAHFQRVLMLDPKHVGAEREVRIHEMRRDHEREQSGFLRRLLSVRPGPKTG